MKSAVKILGVLALAAVQAVAQDSGPPTTSSPAQNSPPAITVRVSKAKGFARMPAGWEAPKYPERALKNKTGGDVVLTLKVDEKGGVKDISVVSGDPEFTKPAIDAAHKWKYPPYYPDGRWVTVSTSATIRFKVADDGQPRVSAVGTQVVKADDGVVAPVAVFSPDPQYSSEAAAARYLGNCVLALTVGPDGKPTDIRVSRSVGMGLDQQAIEALQNWRFNPGTKDGNTVPVATSVQVQFHLF